MRTRRSESVSVAGSRTEGARQNASSLTINRTASPASLWICREGTPPCWRQIPSLLRLMNPPSMAIATIRLVLVQPP